MSFLQLARKIKHQGFMASKRSRRLFDATKLRCDDWRWARAAESSSYKYDPELYGATFLTRDPLEPGPVQSMPRILWAFWLGPEEPTPRRQEAIAQLDRQKGLDFRLVREGREIEVDGHPFHPAYTDLNPMHKSDYLRAYAMHHFGGLYVDIKSFPEGLGRMVHRVNANPETLLVGYREVSSSYVPELPRQLGRALRLEYRRLIGPSGFGFRPESVFTAEWMRELNRRLDYYQEALREADWGQGSPYRKPLNYPIRWSEILGDIIQPLCLKYQSSILFTDDIRPNLADYR